MDQLLMTHKEEIAVLVFSELSKLSDGEIGQYTAADLARIAIKISDHLDVFGQALDGKISLYAKTQNDEFNRLKVEDDTFKETLRKIKEGTAPARETKALMNETKQARAKNKQQRREGSAALEKAVASYHKVHDVLYNHGSDLLFADEISAGGLREWDKDDLVIFLKALHQVSSDIDF